ncbi:MAG: DNA polymerase III subunit epsilon [Alphaproteobacteria bacterium]|nr:DNA polymerase III subunit epsilon [Alphaproteobacteria bacterium]
MREIIFDTETTGFGVEDHRVIELGAVELINRLPTGKTFHVYLNPERLIDPGAMRVHGITDERVKDAPKFRDVAHQWLAFVGDATLVAHNAEFDMAFMAMELQRLGLPPHSNPVVDTLTLACEKLPGQRHKLDALCSHYGIDNSARVFHGALLDAQLLAEVYVELTGGLQASFGLEAVAPTVPLAAQATPVVAGNGLVVAPTTAELAAHAAWLAKLVPNSLWAQAEATAEATEIIPQ